MFCQTHQNVSSFVSSSYMLVHCIVTFSNRHFICFCLFLFISLLHLLPAKKNRKAALALPYFITWMDVIFSFFSFSTSTETHTHPNTHNTIPIHMVTWTVSFCHFAPVCIVVLLSNKLKKRYGGLTDYYYMNFYWLDFRLIIKFNLNCLFVCLLYFLSSFTFNKF